MTTTLIKDEKCTQPNHKDRRYVLCGQDGSSEMLVLLLSELYQRCLRIERRTDEDDGCILKARPQMFLLVLRYGGSVTHHVF